MRTMVDVELAIEHDETISDDVLHDAVTTALEGLTVIEGQVVMGEDRRSVVRTGGAIVDEAVMVWVKGA